MKKKLTLMMASLAPVAMLTACGDNKSVHKDINPDEYVTLGDYEGMDVEVTLTEVTEEAIQTQIETELNYYVDTLKLYSYDPIADRDVVQEGDVANIDYEGKKDGVAFEGGTATGTNLEIGSGTFIPGFEEGLVGKKVGETVDLELTFPEDYKSADLAGQAVVFTVKVNGIYDASTKKNPELNDELIKKLHEAGMEFETMDAYRENVKAYLEEQQAKNNEDAKTSAIWKAVYDTCEVKEPPTELVDDIKARVYENAQKYADQGGMELNDFIEKSMQITPEKFEEEAQTAAVSSAKDSLVVKAIAKKENIVISQKALKDMQEEEAKATGAESAETYFAGVSDDDYYDYVLTKKVNEFLATVVNVIEK